MLATAEVIVKTARRLEFVNTLIELRTIEENAAPCRELGLSFVELNMNLPEHQVDRLNVIRLREIADKYCIYYTVHLDENLNPCDFNNKVVAAYTETVLQTIEVAKQLNVPVLNMHLHPGVWFTLPDKKVFLFDKYEQEYIGKLTAFRDACTAAISHVDIKICVENCGDYGNKPYLKKGWSCYLKVLCSLSVLTSVIMLPPIISMSRPS